MNQSTKETITFVVLSAIVGMLCVIIPPYLIGNMTKDAYYYAIIPFISKGFANLSILPTSIALFISGFFFGFYRPKNWVILGLAALAVFPLLTVIEVSLHPTSHNLLPFEFIIYGIIDIPSFFGAFIGSRIKMKSQKTN